MSQDARKSEMSTGRSTVPPLLWNMVMDGLLRRLYNAHYQALGYTDDVVLLQKGKFVSSGGMRSISTSALEVMLMLPPLHLFIKQQTALLINLYMWLIDC
jgi:hypothetical protein